LRQAWSPSFSASFGPAQPERLSLGLARIALILLRFSWVSQELWP